MASFTNEQHGYDHRDPWSLPAWQPSCALCADKAARQGSQARLQLTLQPVAGWATQPPLDQCHTDGLGCSSPVQKPAPGPRSGIQEWAPAEPCIPEHLHPLCKPRSTRPCLPTAWTILQSAARHQAANPLAPQPTCWPKPSTGIMLDRRPPEPALLGRKPGTAPVAAGMPGCCC